MSFRKPTKIRSKKILDSARGESCTIRIPGVCNHNSDTVVFAHLSGNKGMGTKNHDIFGVYACSDCHRELDEGYVNPSDEMSALQETQMKLYVKNLIQIP